MRRWLFIALGLAFAVPAQAADPRPGIVGSDDRVIAAQGFEAVGRLNKSGTGFCTATLIRPDLILTAAHCVYYSRTKRPIPPDRLHFVAGWRRGEFVAHRRGAHIRIAPGFVFDAPNSEARLRSDIALIELDRPISRDQVKPMPFESAAKKLRLTVPLTHVSYAKDRAHLPSIETGCIVRQEDAQLLLTDCDSNYGSSGAPLLVGQGASLRVVGVTVGVAEIDGLRRTVGVRANVIPALIRNGKKP